MLMLSNGFIASAEDINSMFKNAQITEKINEDSALVYYHQILEVKNISNNEVEIYGKTLRKVALLNAAKKDETENIVLCKKAISYFQKKKNKKEIGITYNAMANIYQIKGYFDLAIAFIMSSSSLISSILIAPMRFRISYTCALS